MTNSTLYDLFIFGNHTGSRLELLSYARSAKVANTGVLQATTDRTYYFIEIWLRTIMIFITRETNSIQVVTLGCQNLICSCSYLIVTLKLSFYCYFCKDLLSLQTQK